ncbi:MAG: type II toxin-antitoxin system HicB family antitoxin [Turicibacter sp.]|nr:type II toxin-antitoxin system HicB family antitoxin [Turicibacter sp.]
MEYVYPAIFHSNSDKSYTITYPDLPECISEGKNLGNAIYMAHDALTQWIEYLVDKQLEIPNPSDIGDIKPAADEFVNIIRVDVRNNRAVKRTVSIPKWLDNKAVSANLSLSRVLQEALIERFS